MFYIVVFYFYIFLHLHSFLKDLESGRPYKMMYAFK